MNIIETLVDGAFVINLAHRGDRLQHVKVELNKIGYEEYERFDAYGVNHLPPERYYENLANFEMTGWWGNKFSHYGVIEKARDRRYKAVAVFEDDVKFPRLFCEVVECAVRQLADLDWDWLQFGGNHRFFGGVDIEASPIDGRPYIYVTDGLQQATRNLARITKMLTAHAYVARQQVYDFILDHAIGSTLSIDGFYAYEVHPRFKCYCVTPCVARQIPGVNDIGNCYADYTPYIGD